MGDSNSIDFKDIGQYRKSMLIYFICNAINNKDFVISLVLCNFICSSSFLSQ